jgi:hypothetical protein
MGVCVVILTAKINERKITKMKKVINRKKYDTETATPIGQYHNDRAINDFRYYWEQLYQKTTGEYFLYGEGGPMSKYARSTGDGYDGGEKIIPLTREKAREWAEKYLEYDEYATAFGEPDEGEGEEASGNVPSVLDLLEASGMTRRQLSERFNIPLRTVQNWCVPGNEHRECPVYVRQMMQEILKIK